MDVRAINEAIALKCIDNASHLEPVLAYQAAPTMQEIIATLKSGEEVGSIVSIAVGYPKNFAGKVGLKVDFLVPDQDSEVPFLFNVSLFLPTVAYQELMQAETIENSDKLWGFGRTYGLQKLRDYYHSLHMVQSIHFDNWGGFLGHLNNEWADLTIDEGGGLRCGAKVGWEAICKYFDLPQELADRIFNPDNHTQGADPKQELMRIIKVVLWTSFIHVK